MCGRGECVVGGMHGRGGGMHCKGESMAEGCMVGGMHGEGGHAWWGNAWWGDDMVGGGCMAGETAMKRAVRILL